MSQMCRVGRLYRGAGASDPDAVLDARVRVRGTEALRVVDGASMPGIVRGMRNAPIIMLAGKIADDIRGASEGARAIAKLPKGHWSPRAVMLAGQGFGEPRGAARGLWFCQAVPGQGEDK